MRVDIWSDVVCPWCYIGKRRFERALASFEARDEVQIHHRAFQLNPHAPRDRVTDRAEMLKTKYGLSSADLEAMETRLVRIAADEGLAFQLDGQGTGNTFDAHRLVRLGLERNRQDAVVERLYGAYFSERRSIFDAGSLATLAREAGLDEAEARDVLAGGRYSDAVAADMDEARALGIRGVPFFRIDGRLALSGAQPSAVFRDALASVQG